MEWTRCLLADGMELCLKAAENGLCGIDFAPCPDPDGPRNDQHPILLQAGRELRAYFAGELRDFTVPLCLRGTGFQLAVWSALRGIPYGETWSYRQLAAALGAPKAVRAVGLANGRNPVPIIVPCHRVIGSDGSLVGYGGGLPLKRILLDLEAGRTKLAGME